MTTYQGVDYGCGRSNIDKATGIRFGVISQNSLNPDALNDVLSASEDLTHKAAVEEAKASLKAVLEEITSSHGIDGRVEEVWDRIEDDFNDSYAMRDSCERDWQYSKEGYVLSNCLQSDIFVTKSPFFTYAQFCSPCVPGAGNLDSPFECAVSSQRPNETTEGYKLRFAETFKDSAEGASFTKCYCLGPDFFDDNLAPYPVYSVETGNLV